MSNDGLIILILYVAYFFGDEIWKSFPNLKNPPNIEEIKKDLKLEEVDLIDQPGHFSPDQRADDYARLYYKDMIKQPTEKLILRHILVMAANDYTANSFGPDLRFHELIRRWTFGEMEKKTLNPLTNKFVNTDYLMKKLIKGII